MTGYGMTEAGVTHVNKTSNFRGRSVGKHMDLVEVKVRSFLFYL